MEGEKETQTGATFFTQTRSRPKTSHIIRNKTQLRQQFSLDPQIDPSAKLKSLKEEVKRLQGDYLGVVTRLNDSKKVIDKQYRHSQKRKIQFLNLYEHRRIKIAEQKMMEEKLQQQKKLKHGLREKTKSMKLNGQIRSLLLRNQLQDNNSMICARNRLSKQKIKQEIQKKKDRDLSMARSSFSRIKAGENELQDKMRRIMEMQTLIGRSNHCRKLGQQVGMVERLDKMLGELCTDEFCDDCLTQPNKPVFLTEKP